MKNDLELEISISHQEGWSCSLWSALWSPHAGAVWNSQDVLSCLTLPLQVLSTPAKPTSTGCRHSNSVSAWIWHLFYLWLFLVQLSAVLRPEMRAPLQEQLLFTQLLPSCGRPWHQQCWPWLCVHIHGLQSLLWYQVMLLLGFFP